MLILHNTAEGRVKNMKKIIALFSAAIMTLSAAVAAPSMINSNITASAAYTTSAQSISGCTVKLSKTSYLYNSGSACPAVTVKKGSSTLKKNTDYTVSYQNNKNVGCASVIIKGKGKYSGTKTVRFSIKALDDPTGVSASSSSTTSIKLSWNKVTYASGYYVQRYNSSSKKYENITTTSKATYTNTGLTSGKTYKYRICAYRKIGSTTYKTYSSAVSKSTITQKQYYKNEVLRLVNIERAKAGVSPLKANTMLDSLADTRAGQIRTNFSHTYNGKNAGAMLSNMHYSWNCWSENIAAGQKTPEQVVKAWMNSSSHKKTILNPDYHKLGVGYNNNYWVQIFTD